MNLGDVVNFKCVDGMKFVGSSLSTTCKVSDVRRTNTTYSTQNSMLTLKCLCLYTLQK